MMNNNKVCLAHHWHCEQSNGETSRAECVICHAHKVFYNIVDGKRYKTPNLAVEQIDDFRNIWVEHLEP